MVMGIKMEVFSVKHTFNEGLLKISATVTHHPKTVRDWINKASNSLENEEMKIIGLDSEYTENISGMQQRATVLQLCLKDVVLVYHIIHAPTIPGELHDFISQEDIFFCGAGIRGDRDKLVSYNLDLKHTANLQEKIHVPDCEKQIPSLFDVANYVLGTMLKKGDETLELRASGWEIAPLTDKRIRYAGLDAHVSFEIAARSKELVEMPSPAKEQKKKKKKKRKEARWYYR